MRARHEGLADGPAHLLLLRALLAVGQARRDLGQRPDGVVAGLAGLLGRVVRYLVGEAGLNTET